MPRTAPKTPLTLPDGRTGARSVEEVAAEARVSKAVVYREIERGSLKASRLGGVLRVFPEAFDAWVSGDDA